MMSPISTQPRISAPNRGPSKHCEQAECKLSTREGKPFCPDHVAEHVYVRNIQDQLLVRTNEWKAVEKKGGEAVDVAGTTAKEILLILTMQGSRTIKRISREVNLDSSLVESYIDALKKAGLVQVGRTTRGNRTVALCK